MSILQSDADLINAFVTSLVTPVVVAPPPPTPPPAPPPPAPAPSALVLTPGVFTAILCPDYGRGPFGGKHTSFCVGPNGRIYAMGGDYGSTKYDPSYRQGMYSLDMAVRMASTDRDAGWAEEYSYEGIVGQTQPKYPDFCSWNLDTRGLLWYVLGQYMLVSYGNPPGETPDRVTNPPTPTTPGYTWGDVMVFDPATRKWRALGIGAGPHGGETWWSVYDPVKDVQIRLGYDQGCFDILDCKKALAGDLTCWSTIYGVPIYHASKTKHAVDLANRRFFTVDRYSNNLYAVNLDTYAVTPLGHTPATGLLPLLADGTADNIEVMLEYDAKRGILFLIAVEPFGDKKVFGYYPATAQWFAIATTIAPATMLNFTGAQETLRLQMRSTWFDPVNDYLGMWGGLTAEVGSSCNSVMFLYRHSATVEVPIVATAPPVPAPTPTPIPTPVAGLAINSVDPDPGRVAIYNGTSGIKGIVAYSGAAVDLSLGAAGKIRVTGGGDGDYWGNEVVDNDLATGTWSLRCKPSTAMDGTANNDASVDAIHGEYKDGSPMASHTYDHLQALDGQLYLAVIGSGYGAHKSGFAHVFDSASGQWSRFSVNACQMDTHQHTTMLDPGARVIYRASASGMWTDISKLDLTTKTWTDLSVPSYDAGHDPCSCYALGLHAWVMASVVGPWNGSKTFRLAAFDLNNLKAGLQVLPTVADAIPPGAGTGYGVDWWKGSAYVFRGNYETVAVYRFTPPAGGAFAGPWVCTRLPASLPLGQGAGVFSRWRHVGGGRFADIPSAVDPVAFWLAP